MSDAALSWDESNKYSVEILKRTLDRIELFEYSRGKWPFAESLKSLSEDTAQEYEGRALFELIQNGHDAMGDLGKGRIHISLARDAEDFGVLYVANEGQPFTESNFRAIIEVGLSDKNAGEGIGNKGLGFRSVLQLTDWPEVYSKSTPLAERPDGFCFRFPRPSDICQLVPDPDLAQRVIAEVSPLALPIPAEVTDPRVIALAAAGFSTVIRIPLRNTQAGNAAFAQIESLATNEVPVQLFLNRLSAIEIVVDAEDSWTKELTRVESPLASSPHTNWLSVIDLGETGRFLRAVRPVPEHALRSAIEASIEAREIDARWRDWTGVADVSIVVGLDTAISPGQLYTFLPMSGRTTSPFAGHAHAPFFTKLARLDISFEVEFNRHLLQQIAALARDLVLELTRFATGIVPVGTTIDLACWTMPDFIVEAFAEKGLSVTNEAFVPVINACRWATIDESYRWNIEQTTVITHRALSGIDVMVVDPDIGRSRGSRLEQFHRALMDRNMTPELTEVAEWCEQLSLQQQQNGQVASWWMDFYDDLSIVFEGNSRVVSGRKLILDQQGKLVPTLSEGTTDAVSPQVFFSPDEEGAEGSVKTVLDGLGALGEHIAFTHPDLRWRRADDLDRQRPGREFLEQNLVAPFRATNILKAVSQILQQDPTEELCRDSLTVVYRLFPTLNAQDQGRLAQLPLRVPLAKGSWCCATDALFHPEWETDAGVLLGRFLTNGGDSIPGFAGLADGMITSPPLWPVPIDDLSMWRSCLRGIGVRDGLLLDIADTHGQTLKGSDLSPRHFRDSIQLSDEVQRKWHAMIKEGSRPVSFPRAKYVFSNGLAHLPDLEMTTSLDTSVRLDLAELILIGLSKWSDEDFSVRIRRPGKPVYEQDQRTWPTPLSAQLRSASWIPLIDESASEGVRFVRPDQAWFLPGVPLPAYLPTIHHSAATRLEEGPTSARLKTLGLRTWGDAAHGAGLVRELGELFGSGSVQKHLYGNFREHYQRGWQEAFSNKTWPWKSGQTVRLVATEFASLISLNAMRAAGALIVTDEENHQKEALIAVSGRPVLLAAAVDGANLVSFLRENGLEVRGSSEVDVKIESFGMTFTPSADRPLVNNIAPWFPLLVGLLLELKFEESRRQFGKSAQEFAEHVASIRLAKFDAIHVVIDGQRLEPPNTARSLPVPDDQHPTIVLWRDERGWSELAAAASSICQLIEAPDLKSALELALLKLGKLFDDQLPLEISDESFSLALEVPLSKVSELREGLVGELAVVKYRLRPALVCLVGVEHADRILRTLEGVGDLESLPTAIAELLSVPETRRSMSPGNLLAAVHQASSLPDLRESLSLDYGDFNDALVKLGPPYRPITDPDLQARTFSEYVETVRARVVDLLRERYAPIAESGEDVRGYVEGRSLEGLHPDPGWVLRFRVPPVHEMDRLISQWLSTHGARDVACRAAVTDLRDLQSRNQERLVEFVGRAQKCIQIWCERAAVAVPPAWIRGPLVDVNERIEEVGLADLVELSDEVLLRLCSQTVGWPEGMELTVSPEVLDLPSDLRLAETPLVITAEHSTRSQPVVRIGEFEVVAGPDGYEKISQFVSALPMEGLLAQTGNAALASMRLATAGHAGGLSRTIAVQSSRATEDERNTIGLVGEQIAGRWLRNRYQSVRWRSGYAAMINHDSEASDSLGYDFEVTRGGNTLFFEVKSTIDHYGEVAALEMGESEVRAAQECAGGDRYRILLLTSVLKPDSVQILSLPNPFSKEGAEHYRVVGAGIRLGFRLKI